jgi:hypothetical protein
VPFFDALPSILPDTPPDDHLGVLVDAIFSHLFRLLGVVLDAFMEYGFLEYR